MHVIRAVLIFAICLLSLARPAHAAPDQLAFLIKLRGLTAGTLLLTGEVEGGRYAVSGVMESTGLVRILRAFGYRGSARGRVTEGRFAPDRYQGQAFAGQRQVDVLIDYPAGAPQVLRYTSSRETGPDSPDPATQTDAVDQLTAGFAILRDVAPDAVCRFEITIFDGRRRSSMALNERRDTPEGVVCTGAYRRLLGYTEDEMARSLFPLEVVYAPTEAGTLRVEEVRFRSLYGPLVLDRR